MPKHKTSESDDPTNEETIRQFRKFLNILEKFNADFFYVRSNP